MHQLRDGNEIPILGFGEYLAFRLCSVMRIDEPCYLLLQVPTRWKVNSVTRQSGGPSRYVWIVTEPREGKTIDEDRLGGRRQAIATLYVTNSCSLVTIGFAH